MQPAGSQLRRQFWKTRSQRRHAGKAEPSCHFRHRGNRLFIEGRSQAVLDSVYSLLSNGRVLGDDGQTKIAEAFIEAPLAAQPDRGSHSPKVRKTGLAQFCDQRFFDPVPWYWGLVGGSAGCPRFTSSPARNFTAERWESELERDDRPISQLVGDVL
jgi:hypothetical protein